MKHAAGSGLIAITMLSGGCVADHIPTGNHPICSWTTSPPSNADRVCADTYHTLSDVLLASLRGQRSTVARLVTNPTAKTSILAYASSLRRQGKPGVHVVPSFTMGVRPRGEFGAAFSLVGKTDEGRVRSPNSVYLRYRGGRIVIVRDQPSQDW